MKDDQELIRLAAHDILAFLDAHMLCEKGKDIGVSALVTTFCWLMKVEGKTARECFQFLQDSYEMYLKMDESE